MADKVGEASQSNESAVLVEAEVNERVECSSPAASSSRQNDVHLWRVNKDKLPDGHLSFGWKKPNEEAPLVEQFLGAGTRPLEVLRRLFSRPPPTMSDETAFQLLIEMYFNGRRRREKLPQYNTFHDAVELLKKSKKIVVLSGAGISVPCGIPDFRSANGIYSRLREEFPELPHPTAMFDIGFFRHNPAPFYSFAKEIFPGQFRPSLSHMFIRFLEEEGKLLRNYTQNIDTLERLAGITRIVECHGSFSKSTCLSCRHEVDSKEIEKEVFAKLVARCKICGEGVMKPNIVFFGEQLADDFHLQLTKDQEDIDLLIVMGSSLQVQPVSLIPCNIDENVPQILINREQLPDYDADIKLLGNCDDAVMFLSMAMGGAIREKILSEINSRGLGHRWQHLVHHCGEPNSKDTAQATISVDEFKRIADEPPRKRKAVPENTEDVEGFSKNRSALDDIWEAKFVRVEACLPAGTILEIPPNMSVFAGAELYYSRDTETFSPCCGNPGSYDGSEYSDSTDSDSGSSMSSSSESSRPSRASSAPAQLKFSESRTASLPLNSGRSASYPPDE